MHVHAHARTNIHTHAHMQVLIQVHYAGINGGCETFRARREFAFARSNSPTTAKVRVALKQGVLPSLMRLQITPSVKKQHCKNVRTAHCYMLLFVCCFVRVYVIVVRV